MQNEDWPTHSLDTPASAGAFQILIAEISIADLNKDSGDGRFPFEIADLGLPWIALERPRVSVSKAEFTGRARLAGACSTSACDTQCTGVCSTHIASVVAVLINTLL